MYEEQLQSTKSRYWTAINLVLLVVIDIQVLKITYPQLGIALRMFLNNPWVNVSSDITYQGPTLKSKFRRVQRV